MSTISTSSFLSAIIVKMAAATASAVDSAVLAALTTASVAALTAAEAGSELGVKPALVGVEAGAAEVCHL